MRKEYKFGLPIIYINFSYSEKGYSKDEKGLHYLKTEVNKMFELADNEKIGIYLKEKIGEKF